MIKWNRLRIATIAVAVAAVVSAGTVAAAPATAAQGSNIVLSGAVTTAVPGTAPGTHKFVTRIPVPATSVTPAYNIICYANISGPEISYFNLVVAASATCNYPITSLILTVTLYWNGNIWAQSIDLGTQTVAAYAQGPCIPGGFYGGLFLETTWPPNVQGAPTYSTRTPLATITSSTDC
jgi:hypothetical protein